MRPVKGIQGQIGIGAQGTQGTAGENGLTGLQGAQTWLWVQSVKPLKQIGRAHV